MLWRGEGGEEDEEDKQQQQEEDEDEQEREEKQEEEEREAQEEKKKQKEEERRRSFGHQARSSCLHSDLRSTVEELRATQRRPPTRLVNVSQQHWLPSSTLRETRRERPNGNLIERSHVIDLGSAHNGRFFETGLELPSLWDHLALLSVLSLKCTTHASY